MTTCCIEPADLGAFFRAASQKVARKLCPESTSAVQPRLLAQCQGTAQPTRRTFRARLLGDALVLAEDTPGVSAEEVLILAGGEAQLKGFAKQAEIVTLVELTGAEKETQRWASTLQERLPGSSEDHKRLSCSELVDGSLLAASNEELRSENIKLRSQLEEVECRKAEDTIQELEQLKQQLETAMSTCRTTSSLNYNLLDRMAALEERSEEEAQVVEQLQAGLHAQDNNSPLCAENARLHERLEALRKIALDVTQAREQRRSQAESTVLEKAKQNSDLSAENARLREELEALTKSMAEEAQALDRCKANTQLVLLEQQSLASSLSAENDCLRDRIQRLHKSADLLQRAESSTKAMLDEEQEWPIAFASAPSSSSRSTRAINEDDDLETLTTAPSLKSSPKPLSEIASADLSVKLADAPPVAPVRRPPTDVLAAALNASASSRPDFQQIPHGAPGEALLTAPSPLKTLRDLRQPPVQDLWAEDAVAAADLVEANLRDDESEHTIFREPLVIPKLPEFIDFNGSRVPMFTELQLMNKSAEALREHAVHLYYLVGHERIGCAVARDDRDLVDWILMVQKDHFEALRGSNVRLRESQKGCESDFTNSATADDDVDADTVLDDTSERTWLSSRANTALGSLDASRSSHMPSIDPDNLRAAFKDLEQPPSKAANPATIAHKLQAALKSAVLSASVPSGDIMVKTPQMPTRMQSAGCSRQAQMANSRWMLQRADQASPQSATPPVGERLLAAAAQEASTSSCKQFAHPPIKRMCSMPARSSSIVLPVQLGSASSSKALVKTVSNASLGHSPVASPNKQAHRSLLLPSDTQSAAALSLTPVASPNKQTHRSLLPASDLLPTAAASCTPVASPNKKTHRSVLENCSSASQIQYDKAVAALGRAAEMLEHVSSPQPCTRGLNAGSEPRKSFGQSHDRRVLTAGNSSPSPPKPEPRTIVASGAPASGPTFISPRDTLTVQVAPPNSASSGGPAGSSPNRTVYTPGTPTFSASTRNTLRSPKTAAHLMAAKGSIPVPGFASVPAAPPPPSFKSSRCTVPAQLQRVQSSKKCLRHHSGARTPSPPRRSSACSTVQVQLPSLPKNQGVARVNAPTPTSGYRISRSP